METVEKEQKDVAIPDQLVSGEAGTGREKKKQTIYDGRWNDLVIILMERKALVPIRLIKKIERLEQKYTTMQKRGKLSCRGEKQLS